MLFLATLTLNVRIIWPDPFSDGSSFFVTWVCNCCHQTNQNHRSMMGLTIQISYVYDALSFYSVSFSLMTSLTMVVLVPGHLVRAFFIFLWKFRCSRQWNIFNGRVSGIFSVNWVTKSVGHVNGRFSVSCVCGIFSVSRVRELFSVSRIPELIWVPELFSVSQIPQLIRVPESFSHSKTFIVWNSEFII